MLILALVCTISGILISDGAKFMKESSNTKKVMMIIAGTTLFIIGISLLAFYFGAF